jgi:hypothetical protein
VIGQALGQDLLVLAGLLPAGEAGLAAAVNERIADSGKSA